MLVGSMEMSSLSAMVKVGNYDLTPQSPLNIWKPRGSFLLPAGSAARDLSSILLPLEHLSSPSHESYIQVPQVL